MFYNFDFLFDSIPDGIVIQDLTGKIVRFNDKASKLLGLDEDQLMGRKSIDPRWRSIREDGNEFPGEEHPVMVTIKTGKPLENVIMGVFHPKRNDFVWLEVSSFPQRDPVTNKILCAYAIFRDITIRIKNDKIIQEQSNELFHKSQFQDSILNSESIFIAQIDLEGNYIYVNRTYEKMFSWLHPNGFLGESVLPSICEKDHKKVAKTVEHCLQNPGKVFSLEMRKPSPENELRIFYWEFATFKNESGAVLGLQCLGMDISEHKKLQDDLKEVEERYRSLIDGSDIYNILIDRTGRIQYANKKLLNSIEKSAEELSHNPIDLWDLYDNKQDIHQNRNDLNDLFLTGIPYSKTMNINLKGKSIWVSGTASPVFDDEKNVISAHISAIDISEIREKEEQLRISEERYRNLIEATDALVSLVDLDGKYLILNNRAAKYAGNSPEFYLGKTIWDTHTKKDADAIFSAIEKVATEMKGFVKESSLELFGELRFYRTSYQPVRNFAGLETCILIMASDITDRIKSEKLLAEKESLYRNLVESSENIIATFELDGTCSFANSYASAFVGLKPSEIVNRKIKLQDIFPADRIANVIADFDKLVTSKRSIVEEVEFPVNGEIHYFKTSLIPIQNKNGDVVSILLNATDITTLRDSQRMTRRLSQVINQSPLSIILTDLEGNIEYTNDAVAQNIGYSKSELSGKNPRIWKSDKHSDQFYKEFWNTILAGDIWRGEFQNIRKDGELIIESSTAFPIYNDNGEITSLAAIQENITERKAVESELKLFHEIFNYSINGQLILDQNRIIHVNSNFINLFGWNDTELKSKAFESVICEHSIGTYKLILNRLEKSLNAFGELEVRSKNQAKIPVLLHAITIFESDQKKYTAISLTDLTERKKIENEIIELNLSLEEKIRLRTKELEVVNDQLSTFFDASIDLLSISTQEGRFVKVSKSFVSILGYREDEYYSRNYIDFVHPEDRDETMEAMSFLNEQKPIFKFVNRYKTKSGEYRFIEWFASPVGEFVYAVARDVTETLEQNRKLVEAREQAEFANNQKSIFLSRMSHELRTPMNSILGFAQILEMSGLNDKQESAVLHILKSGKHLLGLINEVLEISRIESGSVSISIEPVNITAVTREVVDLIKPLTEENSINIYLDDSFNSEYFVQSDQQRTKQILTNIISNAIKYNKPNGRVEIHQKISLSEDGREFICTVIKDTGVGIDESELPHLFNPFNRAHAENSSIEGTGLGLSVVKQLIEILGGQVGVTSKKGEGTTFWIDLPRSQENIPFVIEESKVINTENQNIEVNTHHVLYIEDNPSNIALVKQIFENKAKFIQLTVAMNGKEGLKEIEARLPDLLLLDLDLPDMHGSEILRIIRNENKLKNLPVVVVSADATKDKVKTLFELGANDYITKPLDINHFIKVVEKHLNKDNSDER